MHSPLWALVGLPFGVYDGASTFGAYDALSNDLGAVAAYAMRPCDYPNYTFVRPGTTTGNYATAGPGHASTPGQRPGQSTTKVKGYIATEGLGYTTVKGPGSATTKWPGYTATPGPSYTAAAQVSTP